MKLVEQLLIREPDQIVEVNRNEPIGILNLQVELGSVSRVFKAVLDVPESSGFAKHPGRFLEIVLAHGFADLQPAGRDDFVRRIPLRTRRLDGNKFESRRRQVFRCELTRTLSEASGY